ncbi:yacG [Wigglesworthia glossinidia endosymbiont of Glossina brevipalpis]|uniref:DNA gyrase inhibitor YacG n=1 Tax=Wigglesworthia glossinidia brevipalpis TaxID=36870 RepID=YACG_WIGBR|nr:RecName: Full=DNA gyrase inhibitor YacG [Wigglesworthia glossinidia endosymbiont of Glossina brevipalpis]BAC24338.1 yacG [Wigglesworthia glossinidia endosymbiont of Glossina brevipalpis]
MNFGNKIKCSICKKKIFLREKNLFFPFCSKKCKIIDLYQWISGKYKLF